MDDELRAARAARCRPIRAAYNGRMRTSTLALLAGALTVPSLAQDEAPGHAPEHAAGEAPDQPRGVFVHEEAAGPGYTLFNGLMDTKTYLIDMDGEVVRTWTSTMPPGQSVYLTDEGHLLRTCRVREAKFRGGGQGGRVEEYDWDGNLVWSADLFSDLHCQHHDIEPMPNGHLLVLVWEARTHDDAVARGRDPKVLAQDQIWPDAVLEIVPEGTDSYQVVWEWHSWDHLVQDFAPEGRDFGDVTTRPERIDINGEHRAQPPLSAAERERLARVEAEMKALGYAGDDEEEEEDASPSRVAPGGGRPGDWLHSNAIDYCPEYDLIVLSVRNFSELWVLDHSTTTAQAATGEGGRYGRGGDLLYRWGNPRMYGAGTAKNQRLFHQHDATFLVGADGVLSLLVFNNGQGRPGEEWSEVLELALPFDPEHGFAREDGAAFGPQEPTWVYDRYDGERFLASFISGAQRLTNGHTLVSLGPQGLVLEVDASGKTLWAFDNPFGSADRPDFGGPPPGVPPGEEGGRGRFPGPPGGPPGPGGPGGPGRGGPGLSRGGIFRAVRLAPDHPGIALHLSK